MCMATLHDPINLPPILLKLGHITLICYKLISMIAWNVLIEMLNFQWSCLIVANSLRHAQIEYCIYTHKHTIVYNFCAS